jgi:hypothetical protein
MRPKIVGDKGEVTSYEGSETIVEDLQTVIKINDVEHVCRVEHAIIAEDTTVTLGG